MTEQQKHRDLISSLIKSPAEKSISELLDLGQIFLVLLGDVKDIEGYSVKTDVLCCELIKRYESLNPTDFNVVDGKGRIAAFLTDCDLMFSRNYFQRIRTDFENNSIDFFNSPLTGSSFRSGRFGAIFHLNRCIHNGALPVEFYQAINLSVYLKQCFQIQHRGIAVPDEGYNIRPVVDLKNGTAGHLIVVASLYDLTGDDIFKQVAYGLLAYLKSAWIVEIKNWGDFDKNITNAETHYLHLEKIKEQNTHFFDTYHDDWSFWNGTQGVAYALLIGYQIFNDKAFLTESNKGIKSLVEKRDLKYTGDTSLFILFLTAWKTTKNKLYLNFCNEFLDAAAKFGDTSLERSAHVYKMIFTNAAPPNIFPFFAACGNGNSVKKRSLNLEGGNLKIALFANEFPKTFWALKKISGELYLRKVSDFKNLKRTELKRKVTANIKILLTQIESLPEQRLLREALKFDLIVQYLYKNFSNKARVRAEELFTLTMADKILALSEGKFLATKFIVNPKLDAAKPLFNWKNFFNGVVYPLQNNNGNYLLFLLSSDGVRETAIPEIHFLLLQQFIDGINARDAIENFKSEILRRGFNGKMNDLYPVLLDKIRDFVYRKFLVTCDGVI